MALRVWLPLNGDLNNYGLSTVTASSGTAAYGTGKIGAKGLDLINSTQINLFCDKLANATTFSICCWIKGSKDTSDSDWVSPIRFGVKKSSTAENYDFRFGKHDNASGTEGYPVGVYHNSNNTISSANNAFTTADDWGKWVHICFIYDGTNIKGYKNGAQVFSHANGQGGYLTGNFRLRVGRCNWLVNDLRIYDSCLSAAEVKEIAQGLVLHYKLDGGVFGNPNLYTGSEKFTGSWGGAAAWTTSSDTFQNFVVKEKSSVWGGLYQNISCAQNDIFTISFWGRVDSGGTIRSIHRSNLGNTTTGLTILAGNFQVMGDFWVRASDDGTQWKRYWATVKITSSDITYLQWRLENSTADKKFQICGIKLEKGDTATPWCPADSELDINRTIAEDSSGYNHNGTISDNLTISANTPRYSSSIHFNGSDTYIACGRGAMVCDAITVNIWAYMDTWVNTPGRIASCTQGGGWNFEYSSGRIVFQCGTGDTTNTWAGVVSPATITYGGLASGWHMFTGTYDGLSSKLYIDGEFINANNQYTTHTPIFYNSSNGIFLGAEAANNQVTPATPYFNGLLSDFRIYCTPLLDTDIKSLYNVGMKVDKGQNIHTHEIKEDGSAAKIKKTAITQAPTLIEGGGLLNNITSYSVKPGANATNQTSNSCICDFSEVADLGVSIALHCSYTVSWSNMATGTAGTLAVRMQGSNTRKSDGANVWAGANYIMPTAGGYTTNVITISTASGSQVFDYNSTIPASWFDAYTGSRLGIRIDYSDGNGTITVSNIKVTYRPTAQIGRNYIKANQFIER